jgi:hypothetical protein
MFHTEIFIAFKYFIAYDLQFFTNLRMLLNSLRGRAPSLSATNQLSKTVEGLHNAL